MTPAGQAGPGRITAPEPASGEFVDLEGVRHYVIRDVDRMPPFFISVVSSADHWLFASSAGGLTAGRVSPDNALFPYIPVDRIHDVGLHTGCRTILRTQRRGRTFVWEPFNREHDGRFDVRRNLYKSVLGDSLCFEEVNHDLGLAFRYTWVTSGPHGFVRRCELVNLTGTPRAVELLDGLQNILPAGTPAQVQANASNLVDAYKWSELDAATGLAMYALYAGIWDRAEPRESLRANVVYGLGLDEPVVLLSTLQLDAFRRGGETTAEHLKRGIRGAYFVRASVRLPRRGSRRWQLVANLGLTQVEVVELRHRLGDPQTASREIAAAVKAGRDELARILGSADGFQLAAEEPVAAHHCANVLFNVLRGGIFADQYRVPVADFLGRLRHFNRAVHERHRELLAGLPPQVSSEDLLSAVRASGDAQLERLCLEYLPITFGRRHGDPSRPWNRFAIRLTDEHGDRLLAYEGNWRDIFQNWEALVVSYPEFIESVVAKFVNASTPDGHNPYRITSEGIDWEVEEPDDPWSYIGYWGDHQIIYLLKLLELSRQFHPERLGELLHRPLFSYANVPYRIKSFAELVADPKNTVHYDHALADTISERVAALGADGKLVLDERGGVYQVTLLEKLLVPLLAKLGNLVVGGGIWLNTQRPEWNDANNALVGHGVSMVTLYYMRRYLQFLQELLSGQSETVELSAEVASWLSETAAALAALRPALTAGTLDERQRWQALAALGEAAGRYRDAVYRGGLSGKVVRPLGEVVALLDDARVALDQSIVANRLDSGAYVAYNLLSIRQESVSVEPLYLMLEGQVAALSSGAIGPAEAASLVEALFDSDLYRADQRSFMLYPDRPLPGFLEKNRVPAGAVEAIPLLCRMLDAGDDRIVSRDADGCYRFSADFANVNDLEARLATLRDAYTDREVEASLQPLRELYEQVFRHQGFTGRSGTMFGFEGLGCIYWHMVAKFLLAVQENFFAAPGRGAGEETCRRLGHLYYRVREGIGFNKTPREWGAFPTDPYSHTPAHGGAQQPGMTGQVKEELLTRFGELGMRVAGGLVRFDPRLLRAREFGREPSRFRYLDVDGAWQELDVPAAGLAFTWCQVPIVYRLTGEGEPGIALTERDGETRRLAQLSLPAAASTAIFRRSGAVRRIEVTLPAAMLLSD